MDCLSTGINILTGDDLISVEFGPKSTDPNRKDERFTFYTRRAVQSAIADLVANGNSVFSSYYDSIEFYIIFVISFITRKLSIKRIPPQGQQLPEMCVISKILNAQPKPTPTT